MLFASLSFEEIDLQKNNEKCCKKKIINSLRNANNIKV